MGHSKVNYDKDPKGFSREPSSCQARESCLQECESVKETLGVWSWTSAAGVPQGDDIAAAVAVRDGGEIVHVDAVRAATAGRGV